MSPGTALAHGLRPRWLGRLGFDDALSLQEEIVRDHARHGDTLLLLEHDPVYTTGRRGKGENLPPDGSGVPLRRIGRGGDVTYHGPGQLVGYALVDLRARGGDVHRFLRSLEAGVIALLGDLGVVADRLDGRTGAWVVEKKNQAHRAAKIASIGIGVRRGISMHGFAVNVSLDLAAFDAIVPCDIPGRPHDLGRARDRPHGAGPRGRREAGGAAARRSPASAELRGSLGVSAPVRSGRRHPDWIRVRMPSGEGYRKTRAIVAQSGVATVCEEAHCPNIAECWAHGTATFMLMGDTCTRNCGFCAVSHGRPAALDPLEPARLATAVERLGLGHVVITSVDRDDLKDFGAAHFAATARALRARVPSCRIEVLTPDFQGSHSSVVTVAEAPIEIYNHNLETVPRLYKRARAGAQYERSLDVLRVAGETRAGLLTKAGLMLGLGEEADEVVAVLRDLRSVGCDILTLGQYLQPSRDHLPVERYLDPQEFRDLGRTARELGFGHVESGPLVRSSYHAWSHVPGEGQVVDSEKPTQE